MRIAAGAVLAWGAPRLRDLPWRPTRDPWAVLVSEVMLQQTQARAGGAEVAGVPRRVPDPAACAARPLGDVLRLWQGLGYPRRARNLHDAAAAIVERHDGGARRPRRRCSPCPASGRTRPAPCWRSLRARRRGGRHQHRPGAGPRRRATADAAAGAGARRRARPGRRRAGRGTRPDGPRRHRVPAGAAVRRLPGRAALRVAARRPARRPIRPSGRPASARAQAPLRGQRPSGARPGAARAHRRAGGCRPGSRATSSPGSSPTASWSSTATELRLP